MTIEANLTIGLNEKTHNLSVKMIRIDNVNYFFIWENKGGRELLAGKILELTYKDSFSLTRFEGQVRSPGIPEHIIQLIKEALLNNRRCWFL